MKSRYEDLYDYDILRNFEEATAFIVRIDEPFVVLGGSQPDDVLRPDIDDFHPVRRRRGGGGVVLLQPDDLWIDWWIPATDPRVSDDVRRNALLPGEWWYRAMVNFLPTAPSVVGDVSWWVSLSGTSVRAFFSLRSFPLAPLPHFPIF